MLILEIAHRAGLSESGILLAVRLAVFTALFALLPVPLIPRTARLALGVALFVFLLPLVGKAPAPDFGSFVVRLETTGHTPFSVSYSQLLFESAVGAALAISLSVGGYAAEALASWIGVLFGAGRPRLCDSLTHRVQHSPRYVIMVLYLAVLAPSLPQLFPLLAESVVGMAPVKAEVGLVGITAGVLAGAARVALLGALIGAVPLFLVALTAELFCGMASRIFPSGMSVGLARTVRTFAVVGGISLVSAGTERVLAAVLDGGLLPGRGAAAAAHLERLTFGGQP